MKILFIGPVGDFDVVNAGYGNAATGIYNVLLHMQKMGKISQIDLFSTLDMKAKNILEKEYNNIILVTHPNSFKNSQVNKILNSLLTLSPNRYLSLVWETDRLPFSWDFLWAEKGFTGFLAPSKFVANMINLKTNKPVYYYPHYLESNMFKKINIEKKVLKEDKFKVLFVGQYTKRKGIEETIKAFSRALGKESNATLTIKYHNMSDKETPLEELTKNLVFNNIKKKDWKARIYTINDKLSFSQMNYLYLDSSLLFFPSRGEGFGLPPAEAMCSGLPVIYTNWSSLPEVCEAPGNIPIQYCLDVAEGMVNFDYEEDSNYAYPNLRQLETSLITKYEVWKKDKRKYYEETSENYKIINKRFGYEAIENHLLNIFNKKENLNIK